MTDFKPCPFCGKQRISLITRLENLKGSSREVDADIAKTIGWRYELSSFSGLSFWINPAGKREELPNFTGSIDAARSIFPNAMLIYANEIGADGLPYVQLCTNTSTNPVTVHAGIGATLEIAWCVSRAESKGLFQ